MSRSLAAIPQLTGENQQITAFAQTVKQNLDQITGQQSNAPRLKKLPETATLAELIAEHNKLVERIQNT